jgi:glycine dehydrogenase
VFDAQSVGISLDETCGAEELETLVKVFTVGRNADFQIGGFMGAAHAESEFGAPFARQSAFLTHPTFNRHHSETDMLRYIRRQLDVHENDVWKECFCEFDCS